MKIIKIILFILLFVGCSKTNNILIVRAKSNSVDCHMCPGYIIIQKGIQKDTLKMGSWGSPPNFNQFKANGRDYIALESSYFSGGINESSMSILSLNEDNYLKVVFDTLVSDVRINELNTQRQEIEFTVPDTLIINQHVESYNNIDEGSVLNDFNKEIIILNRYLQK
jgi:hypothetical protein